MKTLFSLAAIALISYCSLWPQASLKKGQTPQNHTVEIKQLKFIPDSIEVNKGDTVTFINRDYVQHDVTEEKAKRWTSGTLKKDESWKTVVKGDEDYFCTLHVIMKGKIRIKK